MWQSHRVRQSSLTTHRKNQPRPVLQSAIESLEGRTLMTAVAPNVIDIFMGYTATAEAQVGSPALMNDKITRAVALLNQTLANSKVDVSVRLVGTLQTNYAETGVGDTDIAALTNLTDGKMDDVTAAGIAAGADVIDCIVSSADSSVTSGDYSTIVLPYLDNGVLSHEFGHVLGGGHGHSATENGTHAIPYAYEGTLNFGGTSYSGAIYGNLNYYSNPNVLFDGQPTGVAGTGPTAANNALVMNQTAPTVAANRVSTVPDITGPVAELGSIFQPNATAGVMQTPLSQAGWVASDSTTSGGTDLASNAIDGNSATRWSTDTAQAPGQYFQVDLGSAQTFSSLTMDTGPASTNDFPRGYSIYVSNNGADWATQTAIATGVGAGQLTSSTFAPVTARYVRIVQTGSIASQWWSIAELNLGTAAPVSAGAVNFQVIYTDGSGVNVASLGNNNIVVTGPNGFSAPATLLSVDDSTANYGYHLVTYQFTTPGPVGSLSAYTFNIQANTVADTVGNFTPAGPIGGPSALTPDYAGSDASHAAEAGNLAGETWQITDEVGPKYQFGYFDPADYHFSLSQASTLTVNLPPKDTGGGPLAVRIFQDLNGNLVDDGGAEDLNPTSPNVYTLPAGNNYYFVVSSWQTGNIPYGLFTLNVTSTGTLPTKPAPATISGSIFVDTNNNGTQDAGEAGLPLAAVELIGTDYQGNPVATFAYADANGNYAFTNVAPSSTAGYTLTESQPFAYPQGKDVVGSLGGTLSATDTVSGVVVTAGANGTGYTFGELPLPTSVSVSGAVFVDTNNNGVQDPGEQGIAGISVTLAGTDFSNAMIPTLSVVTDANGNFVFNNLKPSAPQGYNLSVIPPTGFVAGIATAGNLGGFNALIPDNILGFTVGAIPGTGYLFAQTPIPANAPPAPTANNATVNTQQNTPTAGTVIPAAPAALFQSTFKAAAVATPGLRAVLVPNTGPYHASEFVLNADGTYSYTPRPNFHGQDTFSYELINSYGRASMATVTINIAHVNQPPTFNTDSTQSYLTSSMQPLDIDLETLITDVDSSNLTFGVSSVTSGTAVLLKDGHTVQYTPNPYFDGVATLHFTSSDGIATSAMSLNVCVCKVDHGATAVSDAAVTLPSTAITLNPVANDSDLDGVGISLSSVTQPKNGTAYIDNEGSTNYSDYRIVYRPNFGFHGTDTFNYTVIDMYGKASTSSISVAVSPGAGMGVDPTNASRTALDIFGTPGNDKIVISKDNGAIDVVMNGVLLGSYHPTGLITAFGGAGNDMIDARGINQTVALFGDSGNDDLLAGTGHDLLVGGGGADTLVAGRGIDDIIAGSIDYTTQGFAPLIALASGKKTLPAGYIHADAGLSQIYCGSAFETIWAKQTGLGSFDILHNRLPSDLVVDLL